LVVAPTFTPKPDVWQRTSQNRAWLARETTSGKKDAQFVAVLTRWSNEPLPKDKFGNEDFSGIEKEIKHPAPAASKKGRLRLVRQGPELLFFAGEDDGDFTLLAREEFGAKDLKDVRILASTGWMGTALEVRVTDFSIRAEKLLKSTTGGGGFA